MGFHFISLVAIIVFLLLGFSPIASVFWATVVALLISFLNKRLRAAGCFAVQAPAAGLGAARCCGIRN